MDGPINMSFSITRSVIELMMRMSTIGSEKNGMEGELQNLLFSPFSIKCGRTHFPTFF